MHNIILCVTDGGRVATWFEAKLTSRNQWQNWEITSAYLFIH